MPSLDVTLYLHSEEEGGSQRGTPLDRLLRSVFYLYQTRGSWWSCIDRSGEATNVYTAKLAMFARKQRSYDAIPPTERM